ncbi:MAG TPA: anti-sigma factor [Acidimicrobiia bacterium]|nr:anti-sigma factor [Acidimicrobiia bacterium]
MDEIHEMTALYIVDALDDLERRRYEQHLDDCANCQAELIELGHGLEADVSNSTESASEALKEAVLAGTDDTPAVSRRFAGLAVGLTAAVAALSVVVAVAMSGEPDLVEQIHGADDVVVIDVEGSPFTNTQVVYSREVGRVIFVADDLPEPGTDRTYQLWLIDDGTARSAGTFLPEDGHATVVLEGTAETGAIVGLTVEPADGSNQPTGEALVAQPLG